MAIVKMKKMVLAAPQCQRAEVFDMLQSNGIVQIMDLKDMPIDDVEGVEYFKAADSVLQAETDYTHAKFAYEFLRHYSNKKKGIFDKRQVISKSQFDLIEKQFDWQGVYEQCRALDEAINQNKNKKSKTASAIDFYSEWTGLDISEDDLVGLRKTAYYIGSIPKKSEADLYEDLNSLFDDAYIERISEKKQDVNLFLLCHMEDSQKVNDVLKKYGFTKASINLEYTPREQVAKLNDEIGMLNREYDELINKAAVLSDNLEEIEKSVDYLSCRYERESAILDLVKTKKTFALEGWVPEKEGTELKESLEKRFQDVYVGFEEPAEDEAPPIKLKNNAFVEPFEMITSMYALPQPHEVDPTPILTPFYILFFGMMAGDIGYGLVMLAASVIALKFMDIEGDARKMMKIILYCSFPTILFGWLFGGFFGNALSITPLWVNPVDKPMDVLYVSLALGIVHLFTGLGVKAYWLIKNGNLKDAIFDVFFWYILLTGLIWLLVSGMVGLPGASVAKYASIIGAVGLLLTQGRANSSIVGKFFGGVYGLYGVTSYIGDVLSYSRLLALGLATGLIGSSFNLLIKLLGSGPVAIIFGIVIFIFGHTFNFLIGMLGTFVHTCRLEYLEFFGKFYEGGGEPFNPLRIKTKFIKVNTEK